MCLRRPRCSASKLVHGYVSCLGFSFSRRPRARRRSIRISRDALVAKTVSASPATHARRRISACARASRCSQVTQVPKFAMPATEQTRLLMDRSRAVPTLRHRLPALQAREARRHQLQPVRVVPALRAREARLQRVAADGSESELLAPVQAEAPVEQVPPVAVAAQAVPARAAPVEAQPDRMRGRAQTRQAAVVRVRVARAQEPAEQTPLRWPAPQLVAATALLLSAVMAAVSTSRAMLSTAVLVTTRALHQPTARPPAARASASSLATSRERRATGGASTSIATPTTVGCAARPAPRIRSVCSLGAWQTLRCQPLV
jgi:hypothetical protein